MNLYDFNGMYSRIESQIGTQNRNGEQCNNESFEQKFAS